MSAGRVILPGRSRAPKPYKEYEPSQTAINDAKLHAKYSLIVLTKIAIRPGNNNDMLEALGLIPTVRKEKEVTAGRWPRTEVTA